jgi:N-acetylglucosamine-6-phosphate deacetylase
MLSALTARQLFSPTEVVEDPLVLIEDHVITDVTTRSAKEVPASARHVEFTDAVLVPGFMDIHIHGGAGHDVMEAGSAALPAVETFLAKHGVTSYFPTTVTAPLETILAALDLLGAAIETANASSGQSDALRARPLGIHLEGPFISHARRGVHPADCLLPPKLSTFERMWEASHGQIKIMTVAPELPSATELIAEATRRGVCVSLGHSDAQLDAAFSGIGAGARHATHTFNAMRPLGHRDPGILGIALADPRLSADIIADGIHVDPLVVDLFLRAKGRDRAVLITDAMSATGMPDGKYHLGAMEIEVSQGYCTSGGTIAGSVLTLDRAVRNVMQFANWNLQSAVQLASWNPARVVREQDRRGMLAAGKIADIVALSPAGEVHGTIVNGRLLASS